MKTATAWIAAAALFTACGGAPGEEAGLQTGQTSALSSVGSDPGAADPAAAFEGTYTGVMTLRYGPYTYTLQLGLEVVRPTAGFVRVPLRDLCPSLDSVDIAPPEALAIVLSAPDAWSFLLPTGEKVRAQSFQISFAPDGSTLTVLARGEVENAGELEWTFVGSR
jgi:hypothetical protein